MKEYTSNKIKKMMVSVNNCQRCWGIHLDLVFQPLKNPTDDYGWWAICPITQQPILLAVRELK